MRTTQDVDRILHHTRAYWISDESTVHEGETLTADYKHELKEPMAFRWVLVRTDAPTISRP